MKTTTLWKTSTLVLTGALAFVLTGPSGISEAEAEAQPHMRAAMYTLKRAENQLAVAKHDKGGHRVAALLATRAAIKQVEQGIKYDNRN